MPRPIIIDTIIKTDTFYIKPNINYIAKLDTVYNDSSLAMKIKFISPIPLHPKSYFYLHIEPKRKLALTESGWFENRFIIYGGIGFNSFSITPTFQIGIGIRLSDLL